MHSYTIHHDNAQQGPFTAEELLVKLNSGEFPAKALAWRPGLAEWGELAAVLRADGVIPPEVPGATPPPMTPFSSPISASVSTPCPDNWLVPAIFSTLCCCLPFGIAGIVYATQVKSKHAAGDYAGAASAAASAKLWTLVAIGLGLLVSVFQVIWTLGAASSLPR